MASRMKEDEKNERIIRGLLKLPENRRCINCNSLGPQYVCTNFWTFVCTNCSGIHREFTHRVKSVSMAKFTTSEVSALQAGGNERAREIYFKELDPQRHSIPDSSNVMRLRDFIKHVYVDRRYTGERPVDRPPRIRMSDKEDTYESRKVDPYRGGSRSPPFENQRYNERPGVAERNDDRSYRYSYDERKSPGSARGEFRKSPVRFEVVDDRRRDDRFGNRRRHEDRRYSDGDMLGGISPNRLKETDTSSPPMVRPIREILGKDTPPLRIGEPPRANGGKAADGSALTQRIASSSSLGSIDGSSVELKTNSSSLIDFNADPEPPATTGPSAELPKKPDVQPDTQPKDPSIDDNNWANFDFSSQTSASSSAPAPASAPASSQGHSKTNTLESLLFELSAPAPAPVGNTDMLLASTSGAPTTAPVDNMLALPTSVAAPSTAVGNSSTLLFNGGAAAAASPVGNMSIHPNNSNASAAAPGTMLPTSPTSGTSTKANDGVQWQSMQQRQSSLFVPMDGPSSVQASNSQSWNSSLAQNAQGPNSKVGQVSQIASRPTSETSGGVASQPPASEVKSTGRKELPEDLFAATYSTAPVPVRGWQPGLSPGMGYGMQYPNAVPMPIFPQSSKPANPFDLNAEAALVHAPSFPSMSSLQGALPNVVAPSGLLRSSSLGTMSPQWMPTQSPSYLSSVQSPSYVSSVQSPSYASGLVPGAYVGQQMHGNMLPSGRQGSDGGFAVEASFFGNLNTDQQQAANRFSQPATPSSFPPLGGNPFG